MLLALKGSLAPLDHRVLLDPPVQPGHKVPQVFKVQLGLD